MVGKLLTAADGSLLLYPFDFAIAALWCLNNC
uniref:Uncharacterized protein n=1 Tax=Arundo donax TaxID=35708 RepID=A0A0A9HDS3_ARUDO